MTVGITNTVGSTISRETDCGIHINSGSEIAVASTKAYTSQIISLVMFALVVSEDRKCLDERRIEIIDGLKMLPELIREVLELDSKVKEIAEDLCDKRSLLLIGRGYSFATCLEGMFVIIVLSGFPYSRLVTKIRNYKTLSAIQSSYIDYFLQFSTIIRQFDQLNCCTVAS